MCLLKPSESAEQLALATEFWADWYSGKRTTVSTMFLLGAYAQTTDEEFRASLRNWQDFDGAAHCLGLRLGPPRLRPRDGAVLSAPGPGVKAAVLKNDIWRVMSCLSQSAAREV